MRRRFKVDSCVHNHNNKSKYEHCSNCDLCVERRAQPGLISKVAVITITSSDVDFRVSLLSPLEWMDETRGRTILYFTGTLRRGCMLV